MSNILIVDHISRNCTEAHLLEIFSFFGKVERVSTDFLPNTSRLSATIVYEHPQQAQYAYEKMNGGCIDGITLQCRFK